VIKEVDLVEEEVVSMGKKVVVLEVEEVDVVVDLDKTKKIKEVVLEESGEVLVVTEVVEGEVMVDLDVIKMIRGIMDLEAEEEVVLVVIEVEAEEVVVDLVMMVALVVIEGVVGVLVVIEAQEVVVLVVIEGQEVVGKVVVLEAKQLRHLLKTIGLTILLAHLQSNLQKVDLGNQLEKGIIGMSNQLTPAQ
jgi:hypothetical protein